MVSEMSTLGSQTATERGEAELRILNFKTTWSEFEKPSQINVRRGEAELRIYNLKKHHLPRVGPKQLCASAHLGCTRAGGTSLSIILLILFSKSAFIQHF